MFFDYIIILLLIIVIMMLINQQKSAQNNQNEPVQKRLGMVLDSSVLLDGRIFDLYPEMNFNGRFLLPSNVVMELKNFADSNSPKYQMQKKQALVALDTLNRASVEYDDEYDELDADEQAVLLAIKHRYVLASSDKAMIAAARVKGVAVCNPDMLNLKSRQNLSVGDQLEVQVVGKSTLKKKQVIGSSEFGELILVNDGAAYSSTKVLVEVTKLQEVGHRRLIESKIVAVR